MIHCIPLPCPSRYFEFVHPYLSHRCALFQQTAAKLRYLEIEINSLQEITNNII